MLPRNLKTLRLGLGMTQGECATNMHISRQTIFNIENGTCKKESTLLLYELYLKDVKRKRDYAKQMRKDR